MTETTSETVGTAALSTGKILKSSRKNGPRVRVDGKNLQAKLAAGCLLEPAAGDLALTARTENGDVYIIQILERAGSGEAILRLPETGKIVAGQKGEGKLRLRAGEIDVEGGFLKSAFSRVAMAARTVECKAELMRERYRRRYEDVEEVKDSHLGRLRCLVGGLLSLRGENVDVRAKKRAKIDGDSVDIG